MSQLAMEQKSGTKPGPLTQFTGIAFFSVIPRYLGSYLTPRKSARRFASSIAHLSKALRAYDQD